MNKLLLFCFLTSSMAYAYKLALIQGLSKTKKTFITRSGKQDGVHSGKKVTFTSNNVSIIATAISVTREFTQWEIDNDFTEVPFQRGDLVTYYDATEHLWALTPEKLKRKYIKSEIFTPRVALVTNISLMRGLSSSVSETSSESSQRGAISYEISLEKEYTQQISWSVGMRYSNEVINVSEASIKSTRLLALFDAKYYFQKMPKFHNARFSLGLGVGYGQSLTQADGLTSSGFASIIPSTKVGLNFPLTKKSDFVTDIAFENMRVEEEFADDTKQSSNLSNIKAGFSYKYIF